MNAPELWGALSRNQKSLAGLAALFVVASGLFGVVKSIRPYTPPAIRAAIDTERDERVAADDSLRNTLQRVLDGQVALLKGQRQLVSALGLAVDVVAAPGSPEAEEARRRLRRMRTRRFDPDQP